MAQRLSKRKTGAKQAALGLQDIATALYVRVSTQTQADEGYSLEAQQERLQAYCTAQGWTVGADHIYVDAGISGKTTARPQFQAMLHAAQAGTVQRIVAMKLDRMARNVREFLATVDQLKAYGCALVLVREAFDTSTPHGKFALTMFAAMAELEASTITERVMSGKAQKASKGGFNGSKIPYGYTYAGGEFTVNNDQAAVVKDIFIRFIRGESLLAIAAHLNAAATPTATGGQWYASTVRYILSNGLYAGAAQWYPDGAKEPLTVEGAYPAIIPPNTYTQAHRRLQALRPGRQVEGEINRRLHQAA